MEHEETPKRRYNSARRQAQARETRRQIVEAARRQFALRGYAGTTMEAVAREAGVAVETVYTAFGSKRAVLARLIEVAVTGDDAATSLLDRAAAQEIRQERDQRQQVRAFARETRALMERIGPLFALIRSAAETEPEISELLRDLLDKRLNAMTQFVEWVAENGPLRPGLKSVEAADLAWTLASPEVYRLLTGDRGWTQDRYERWLSDTLIALLLPSP